MTDEKSRGAQQRPGSKQPAGNDARETERGERKQTDRTLRANDQGANRQSGGAQRAGDEAETEREFGQDSETGTEPALSDQLALPPRTAHNPPASPDPVPAEAPRIEPRPRDVDDVTHGERPLSRETRLQRKEQHREESGG